MSDPKFEVVELASLKFETGAEELMNSPEMEPYMRHVEAAMLGGNVDSCVREIAVLPLEKRYIWRVASALKWAFADLEEWSVVVDRQTLPTADLEKVMKLIRSRPIQFCLFLKALVGGEKMEEFMNHAITVARQ
jgi:hypothetical protein